MSKKYGRHVRAGAPADKKFDMNKEPIYLRWHIAPFLWGFSYVRKWLHLGKVNKVGMKGIKQPYILLCNHNALFDFYMMFSSVAPSRTLIPSAVDNYIWRDHFFRCFGTVPKRKYTTDIGLLRQCRKTLKDGKVFGIYPEARYSLCGVTEIIPESVAQLVKHMKVPVVTFTCRGLHINDPFWGNHHSRYVWHPEADMTLAFTPEELKETSVEEINDKLQKLLYNDDFRWQSENRVKVTYKKRAEGLHKVLYQCPHCMAEYKMDSKNDTIFCKSCNKQWKLNFYGELEASDENTEFKFPTDWYKWEREQVKEEVENGNYHFECDVTVNDLPNSSGFIRLGKGHLVHDNAGFHLIGKRDYDGEPFEMNIDSAAQYAVHIEYSYRYGLHKDCIDLNTINDTWYVYPENCDFSVTKVSIATEEIFKHIWNKRKEETEVL